MWEALSGEGRSGLTLKILYELELSTRLSWYIQSSLSLIIQILKYWQYSKLQKL